MEKFKIGDRVRLNAEGYRVFERIVGGDSINICVDGECRGTMSVSDFRMVAKVLGV